jgi:hypothetical protein
MTILTFTQDAAGFNSFGLMFSADNSKFTLPASTKKTVTAPTSNSKYLAIFSYEPGAKVWVEPGDVDIVLPTATPTATRSQLNPACRQVASGETISFKTNDTSVEVGVSFYALI